VEELLTTLRYESFVALQARELITDTCSKSFLACCCSKFNV